jgi:triosephosphate isomerase (TIM)
MREYLVAGNWKMNGSRAFGDELASAIAAAVAGEPAAGAAALLVCPPFPYLEAVAGKVDGSPVRLGAQNVSQHESGAYTGEVSVSMLRDVGCEYVIVGHSERRALMGESSEIVAEKFAAALAGGLKPILCLGETLAEREAERTEAVIEAQLRAVFDVVEAARFADAVIAYEPVWAIGTGKTATPEQAQDVHRHIRAMLAGADARVAASAQILYGGSVKGSNALALFAMPDIDGGLIGGASLEAEEFLAIAAAAAAAPGN